ncbi:MAG: prepilin-type N-terminal cleavage/methylation domain-containing protein [Lachnospiraceae bacterium]|nr:prepilin-type N-terminal cleavage/methylation domain-containing protein [Lachnospiraceae bacterium]
MKRMINNNKTDNRGFSLVEVLVAMVIIALVVAPIAALFSSSVRMNMVSKRRMNAVGIAEDTMEAIKANSVSDLCYKFHDMTKFDLIDTALFSTGSPASNVSEVDNFDFGANAISHVTIPGATDDYDFNADLDGDGTPESEYYYEMDNIQFQDGKESYDALIKIDANAYKAASLTDPDLQRTKYNSTRLVDLATIAGDENLSYLQSTELDAKGMADVGVDEFDSTKATRSIIINIKPDETSIDYEYGNNDTFADKVYTSVCDPFVSDGTNEIKNVFLFYRRDYDFNKSGTFFKEDITINCTKTSGSDVNVYLVKLEPAADDLENREKNYRVRVNIAGTGKDKVKVYTNIGYNLAHTLDETVDEEVLSQGTYLFAGSPMSEDEKKVHIFDLANTTSKDRFYDIQIDVYRHDDHSTPVYSLTGSTQE